MENEINIPENYVKVTISSQSFEKDGWRLIQSYYNPNTTNYYDLIECIKCGNRKLVSHYGFINKDRKTTPCKKCKYLSEIGKVYGCTEILAFDHLEEHPNGNGSTRKAAYYKVRCTRCGKESIKVLRKKDWSIHTNCVRCTAEFDTTFKNRLWLTYKNSAKSRNLPFELTSEQFTKLINGDCYYCGSPARFQSLYTRNIKVPIKGVANGIDRVDSSKGYTADNCVSCCTICNLMKLDHSKSDFLNHIEKIHNHFLKQGSTTIENTSQDGSEQSTSQANGDGNIKYLS